MELHERREYLKAIRARYFYGNRWEKAAILNEFCATCGYNRKYAIGLLSALDAPRRRGGARPEAEVP